MDYDLITVGGGLAGSALAYALAKKGVRVLVLERETEFRDRVRGEGILPWGVNEARDLGIYDILADCGRTVDLWTSHGFKRPPRNLRETTPRGSHCINFYHPDMQEAMIAAAEDAGATVRRGVRVVDVEAGAPSSVVVEFNGSTETVTGRLVAGCDGRESMIRKRVGFEVERDPERMMVAGVLLDGVAAPDDSNHVFHATSRGEGALFFPLGQGRVRTYFLYRLRDKKLPLSGARNIPTLMERCIGAGVPAEWLEKAEGAGPLTQFSTADFCVKRPFRPGVALVGDAASANDASWGNGLSLTIRDARILSENLLANDDWDMAGKAYGEAHEEYFGVINRVTRWLTDLLFEIGPEAEARRAHVFSLMAKGKKSRNPDYIALGPDSPSDEAVRKRMFGED